MFGLLRPCNNNQALEKEASSKCLKFHKAFEAKEGETVRDATQKMLWPMKSCNERPLTGGRSSSSKRQKFCVDRFTCLTDGVIGHILSFLPTKYALRTRVLSREWGKHWMSVKNIDFHYQSLSIKAPGYDPVTVKLCHFDDHLKFETCVTRVIKLTNNLPLRRFSLTDDACSDGCPDWVINAVDSVLSRGIRELDVHIEWSGFSCPIRLPCSLLLSTTLEVLKLGSRYLLEVPSSVCLPKLKILSLDDINFADHQSLNRLVSSCPMLEDLFIYCRCDNISVLHVSSPTLKTICLNVTTAREVVLNTPILASLSLANRFPVLLKHPITLVRAELGPAFDYLEEWISFLDQIKNVQSFRLVGVPLMVSLIENSIQSMGDFWPDFPNLTYLCIGCLCRPAWRSVVLLLNKIPRLKTLIFEKGLPAKDVRGSTRNIPTPLCLLWQLKEVVIHNYTGDNDHETAMIKYFKFRGKVLKKLEIHVVGIEPEVVKSQLLDKLKRSKRGSKQCQQVVITPCYSLLCAI